MTNYPFEAGKTYPLRGGGTAEILKVGADLTLGKSIVGIVTSKHGHVFSSNWFSNEVVSNDDLLYLVPYRGDTLHRARAALGETDGN